MKLVNGVFTAYLGKIVFVRFALLLLIISAIWQMLDLLNYSGDVLAVEGAGARELFKYISLSLPRIMSQFIPFAALLAIVFALTSLSISSEITVMRAAGMSVNRVLFPVGLVCSLIAIAHFVFQEVVAVPASDQLEYWRANDFASDLPPTGTFRTDIRFSYDDSFIEAKSAQRDPDQTTLKDVTIYQRKDRLIDAVILAERAVFRDGQWSLRGVQELSPAAQTVTMHADRQWPVAFSPDFLFSLTLNPERVSLAELWRKIQQLNADNADSRSALTSYLSRFSRPLSTLIMPLLAAIAGFGIHRQGVMLARAINGSVLGFGYFILENISLAFGKLGVIPAAAGAFFPLLLFTVIGFAIVLAMEAK